MKTLILVAHPTEQDSGTQAFLAQALESANSSEINRRVLTLPAGGHFNAQQEMQDVLAADRLVLQFPLYWYSAPAVLHQWFEDCLLSPYKEKLAGKELGLVVSTGRPSHEFGLGQRQGYSLSELLRPLAALAIDLGLQLLPPLVIAQFAYQTDQQHQQLLVDYQQYLQLPAGYSFADQEKWWIEQLEQRAAQTTDPKKQQILALLADQFETRSDRLDDLKDELALIKQVEEGDEL